MLKEWLPQPNGYYHLLSVFYTKNIIPKFTSYEVWSVETVYIHIEVSFHIKCPFPAVLP